jgi:hypothetical protein
MLAMNKSLSKKILANVLESHDCHVYFFEWLKGMRASDDSNIEARIVGNSSEEELQISFQFSDLVSSIGPEGEEHFTRHFSVNDLEKINNKQETIEDMIENDDEELPKLNISFSSEHDDDDVPNASYVQGAGIGSSPPREDENDNENNDQSEYPELFEKYKVVKMIGEGI